MLRFIILAAVWAGLGLAADATGKWSGTIMMESGKAPGYMVLEQKGALVLGTAGPSAQNQRKIEKGAVEAGQIIVEARPGPALLKFVMKQDGDQLAGDVFEDGQRIGTVKLERVKE